MAEETVFNNLNPRWTAQIYTATTGEDFLGLRAIQANITQYLMPGIITTTTRARYYAFYCWLIVDYKETHPDGWSLATFIRRREPIFALANIVYTRSEGGEPDLGGLTGSNKLGDLLNAHRQDDVIPLDVDPVKTYVQATWGGYDVYRGVMRTLDLARLVNGADSGVDVFPQGQELAEAFARSIQDTKYYQHRHEYDLAASIPRSVLIDYGHKCHLGYLDRSDDYQPTLEALFAFNASIVLPSPESDRPTRGNMKGTLGLILDMISQAKGPFTENHFREAITYGLCIDYQSYQPSPVLKPFLAHWRMFQLREYYIYALYALWVYFLRWLRLNGPQTLQIFYDHLNERVDLTKTCAKMGLLISQGQASEWTLGAWMDALLDAVVIPPGDWEDRCRAFAQQSSSPLNEHALYRLLRGADRDDASAYVSVAWLLLSTLYLRLCGLQEDDRQGAWYWARAGGARRRSMALFVRDLLARVEAGETLLQTWSWLCRDYIVAQHTLTALEKWRQRKANTFHFNYERGLFEWIKDGGTGFSGTRFRRAYDMLADLGLYETESGRGSHPELTARGVQTLQRVLESGND